MKLRVLIVDADKASCEVIQTAMTASNVEGVMETSSTRAAESLRTEKYDALFLELQMPTPDGLQLTEMARASGVNRRTPIIMVTGESKPDAMTRAFKAGANFFLFKPFDRGRLMRVLRAAHAPIEQERRKFQRVEVGLHAVLVAGNDKIEGTTVDLSLKGMLVEARHVFPVGSQIKFKVDLTSGQKSVNGSGRIVRVAGPLRMGIEFDSVTGEDADRLQAFLLPLILKSVGE